jgi:hypothetical protein
LELSQHEFVRSVVSDGRSFDIELFRRVAYVLQSDHIVNADISSLFEQFIQLVLPDNFSSLKSGFLRSPFVLRCMSTKLLVISLTVLWFFHLQCETAELEGKETEEALGDIPEAYLGACLAV